MTTGWSSIESAPKDGSTILVSLPGEIRHEGSYWEDKARHVTLAQWSSEAVWLEGREGCWIAIDSREGFSYGGETHSFSYIECQEVQPTHWMPLPEPQP